MLQEGGGRGKSCCDGVDGWDWGGGGLAGQVFEGEEGAETRCEGGGFVGEGFAEGEDGGVVGGSLGGRGCC